MNIASVRLYVIKMPLKSSFVTHLGMVEEREGIIVEVRDEDGISGFGEGVAFSTPWYTEETVQTSLHMLEDILIPLLKKNRISHPSEVSQLFKPIRRNNMAKAAIETAIWDCYAKKNTRAFQKYSGVCRSQCLQAW